MSAIEKEGDSVIGVDEAARILGVSAMTVRRLVKAGELAPVNEPNPVLKRPRKVELRLADVTAFKAARQGQA